MSELTHDPFDTREDSSQRDRKQREKAVEEMIDDLELAYKDAGGIDPYKKIAEKLIALGWRKQ